MPKECAVLDGSGGYESRMAKIDCMPTPMMASAAVKRKAQRPVRDSVVVVTDT